MISICRWVLLPIACVVSWYVALVIGIIGLEFARSTFAPEGLSMRGFMRSPRYQVVWQVVLTGSVGLSAVFVVATAFFLAPAERGATGWVAFLVGACVALWFAFGTNQWLAFLAALVAGLTTALVLHSSRFARRYGELEERAVLCG